MNVLSLARLEHLRNQPISYKKIKSNSLFNRIFFIFTCKKLFIAFGSLFIKSTSFDMIYLNAYIGLIIFEIEFLLKKFIRIIINK